MSFNFYVNKYSDEELAALIEACYTETRRRKEELKRRRNEWSDSHVNKFYAYCGEMERVGDTIIVAYYNPHPLGYGVRMGRTTPINGDVFDLDTGIAVAFAKACGERVPDFI